MPAKSLGQYPTLPANGFVQEESAIKVLVEIIVHKFRKRVKRDFPSVKMSDLQEDVISLNSTITTLQNSLNKTQTKSQFSPIETLSESRPWEDIHSSSSDIDSITTEDGNALKTREDSDNSICEIKSLSLDTENERKYENVATDSLDAISISSINDDHNLNESFSSEVFEDVENSIYGNCCVDDERTENEQKSPAVVIIAQEKQTDLLTDKANLTDDRITKIVHELVLQKYEQALKRFRSRSMNRHKRYSEGDLADYWKHDEEDDSKSVSDESVDSGLNCSTEDIPKNKYGAIKSARKVQDEVKVECLSKQEATTPNMEKSRISSIDNQHHRSIQSLAKKDVSPNYSDTNNLSAQRNLCPQETDYVMEDHLSTGNAEQNRSSLITTTKNEEVEYDEQKFLTAALGDELMDTTCESKNISQAISMNKIQFTPTSQHTSSGGSIGSSRISALITDRSEGIDSLYSTVDKKTKKNRSKDLNSVARPLFTAVKEDSDIYYESVFEFKNSIFEEELITQNSLQREIIHQASKALQICRADPAYFGEEVLLEAEKILLVATCKKDVLSKEITKVEYEEIEDSVSVQIALKNIKFRLDYEAYSRTSEKGIWYFICIADAGKTVLSSNLMKHNDNGTVTFADGYKFEDLPSDVEINLRIYAICIPKHEKKSALCRTFGRRKRLRLKETGNIQSSSFVLLGKATLRNHSLQSKSFKLSQVPDGAIIADNFTLDVDVFIRLKISRSGFLTVGKTHKGALIWYRRWCVVEGSRFKYWNYPLETEQEPIGTLDLLNCANQVILEADRAICCRPRTISFEIVVDGTVQQYYLSADNKADLENWQDNLNTVLRALSKWNYLNCYLVN